MSVQTEVLAEQSSDVSLQGTIVRNRVPTSVTIAAGGEPGDAIEWQALRQGNTIWISGVVVKGGAKGKAAPTRKAVTPVKAVSKKPTKPKKGNAVSLDNAFGEDEDWGDDAPNLGITAPTLQRPSIQAVPTITPAVRKGAGGGRYQVPTRK